MYLFLVDNQGGGIHVEEDSLNSMTINFVLSFTVKICSGLILCLDIGY